MLTNPTWPEIALRMALATLAGIVIGFNRETRNQAAGLRTTTLVCLAACLAMCLSNLMLGTTGKTPGSFVQIDVMRLPLGVLSGMGFLGAGAIIRRGDAVVGVTTAATLWFMTVVGLTFGAGEIGLGVATTLLGLITLWFLKHADNHIRRRFRGSLTVLAEPDKLAESDLRQLLVEAGQHIVSWAITYQDAGRTYQARAELEWEGSTADRARAPDFLPGLAVRAGVRDADWTPHVVSA